MLRFLDVLLMALHIGFTLFNLTGWIWKKTRRLHLITLALTIVSWLIIGWYVDTIGYCFLTDWHWDIKRSLGENVRGSFNKYVLDHLFNYDFNSRMVDWLTGLSLVLVVLLSVYFNWKDRGKLKT